jgi:hypothetical protein
VPISIRLQKRHFDLVNGIKGQKKENIAIIEDNSFGVSTMKKNSQLIIINGTKQTEDNIIKIPLTKRSYLKSLRTRSGHKEIWFRGKMGPWKLPLKTQYYFKINESKVWINNQLSEIPNKR